MRDLSLCINLLKSATVKAKLKKQCSFGSISYQVAPSGVEVMSGKGYQAMQSRIPVFNEIMNALKAGERGLSKQAIEDKLFDKMVIASVTRNPDIMKIQGRIADQLGLTFNEESEWGRAGRLRYEQNECKMLPTSREFDVLSSEMEVDKNFSASGLKEDGEWELFKKTAGGDVESPDMLHRFICAKMRIIFPTMLI
uniref:Uncharacterized protein n=1 Tax=Populus trichocarpa TaxID=3694 RepID=A0A2K2CA05_POPTR